jgi:hypothetical protein
VTVQLYLLESQAAIREDAILVMNFVSATAGTLILEIVLEALNNIAPAMSGCFG